MTIQFFPGHMHRARKQIAEVLGRVEVVIELLDARAPLASSNPLLNEIISQKPKPRLIILARDDLADPEVTARWAVALGGVADGRSVMAVDSREKSAGRCVAAAVERLGRGVDAKRGTAGMPVRALVVGIPNTGKSTLINTLAGRRLARVGDEPGITRCGQLIRASGHLLLNDTPGVLWTKFEDQAAAVRLAALGSIRHTVFDAVEVAVATGAYLLAHVRYAESVCDRFRLADAPISGMALIEEVARRRGCMGVGGTLDRDKAAQILLHELRRGSLGRISLETPSSSC